MHPDHPCTACAALDDAPVVTSPHAALLLDTRVGINFGATAVGHAEYYVCHACGWTWERAVARSEPDARWRRAPKALR